MRQTWCLCTRRSSIASGRLVPDLTRDDFEIFDNGVRRDIAVFANEIQPITIVVMLDRSGSMEPHFERERAAAEQFVLTLLPADRARIGSFSNRIRIAPAEFTSDPAVLQRILRDDLLPPGPTPLWNATAEAMTALAPHGGRRVVLVFTDGEDSPWPGGANVTAAEVRARSQAEDVMVYGVRLSDACLPGEGDGQASASIDGLAVRRRGPAGWRSTPAGGILFPGGRGGGGMPPRMPPILVPPARMPFPVPPERRTEKGDKDTRACRNIAVDPALQQLAEQSGGGYFQLKSTDDLAATFVRVSQELHQQYMIAFPIAARDGQVHDLDVRVRGDGDEGAGAAQLRGAGRVTPGLRPGSPRTLRTCP